MCTTRSSHIDSYVEPRCAQPEVHISTAMLSPDVHNQKFTYRQLCWAPMCTTRSSNIDSYVKRRCSQPEVHISTAMLSPDVHNQKLTSTVMLSADVHNQKFTYRQLCWAPMCTTRSWHIDSYVEPRCSQPVFTQQLYQTARDFSYTASLTHPPRDEQPKRKKHTSRQLHKAHCNIRQCINGIRH